MPAESMFVHTSVHNERGQLVMLVLKKSTSLKISKGYRLKKSTHRLIDKLQSILNVNQDTVISKACKMLYKDLISEKKKRIKNFISSIYL